MVVMKGSVAKSSRRPLGAVALLLKAQLWPFDTLCVEGPNQIVLLRIARDRRAFTYNATCRLARMSVLVSEDGGILK
eukprot:7557806-Pyramimonas_sp.AAC.1